MNTNAIPRLMVWTALLAGSAAILFQYVQSCRMAEQEGRRGEVAPFETRMIQDRNQLERIVADAKKSGARLTDAPVLSLTEVRRYGLNPTRDRWGRPFVYVWDHDLDGRIRLGTQDCDHSAIVYSLGANGIDEQGGGDDITTLLMDRAP